MSTSVVYIMCVLPGDLLDRTSAIRVRTGVGGFWRFRGGVGDQAKQQEQGNGRYCMYVLVRIIRVPGLGVLLGWAHESDWEARHTDTEQK